MRTGMMVFALIFWAAGAGAPAFSATANPADPPDQEIFYEGKDPIQEQDLTKATDTASTLVRAKDDNSSVEIFAENAQKLDAAAEKSADQQARAAAKESLNFKTPLAPIEVAVENPPPAKDQKKKKKKKKMFAWFEVDERFARPNDEGNVVLHPFFDFKSRSGADEKNLTANFIAITPAGSDYRYNFDLVSGQIYKEANFCPQKDVWQQYDGLLETPPYTWGIIPRLLDQTGQAQQVIVFGGNTAFQENWPLPRPRKVRIVGGVVEQFCAKYPCLNSNAWSSRPILIAVDAREFDFIQVTNLHQLKQALGYPWAKVVAFLENGKGRTIIGREQFPAYRITGEIIASDAYNYAFTHGHQFTVAELQSLRKNCFALYDYIWQRMAVIEQQVRALQQASTKNLKEMSEAVGLGESAINDFLAVNSGDLRDTEQQLALKKLELLKHQVQQKISGSMFRDFFTEFYEKYGRDYTVCTRYVQASNINYNLVRHWFFTYLQGFMLAETAGYKFACLRRAWVPQEQVPPREKGEGPWDSCSERTFDVAFSSVPLLWQRESINGDPYYRYIDFDNTAHGTHARMYAWVKVNNKNFACVKEGKIVKPPKGLAYSDQALQEIFPEDAPWPKISPDIRRDHLFVD